MFIDREREKEKKNVIEQRYGMVGPLFQPALCFYLRNIFVCESLSVCVCVCVLFVHRASLIAAFGILFEPINKTIKKKHKRVVKKNEIIIGTHIKKEHEK